MPLITLRVDPDLVDIHIQTDKMIIHPGLSPQDAALWALGLYIDDIYPLCFGLRKGDISHPSQGIASNIAHANALVAVPPTAITFAPTGVGPADLLVRFSDDPTTSPFAYDLHTPCGWKKVEHSYFLAPRSPHGGTIHPEAPLALFDPTTLKDRFPEKSEADQDNALSQHPSREQRTWGWVAGVCDGLLDGQGQAELPHEEALCIGLCLAFHIHAKAYGTRAPANMPYLLPTFTMFVNVAGLLLRASPALNTYTTHASFALWRDSLPARWVQAGRAAAPVVQGLPAGMFAQCRALLGHPDASFLTSEDVPTPSAHSTLQTTTRLVHMHRAMAPHLSRP